MHVFRLYLSFNTVLVCQDILSILAEYDPTIYCYSLYSILLQFTQHTKTI